MNKHNNSAQDTLNLLRGITLTEALLTLEELHSEWLEMVRPQETEEAPELAMCDISSTTLDRMEGCEILPWYVPLADDYSDVEAVGVRALGNCIELYWWNDQLVEPLQINTVSQLKEVVRNLMMNDTKQEWSYKIDLDLVL